MSFVRSALLVALAATAIACADGAVGDAPAATVATTGRDSAGTATYDTTLLRAADLGRIKGDSAAPLWIIEVSDFECPYCRRFHQETWAALEARYVRTGKVRVAFLNLPLPSHRNAWPAAEAAMCASVQGRFWPMHDSIFVAQERWATLARTDTLFRRLAVAVGVDTAAFRTCTESHATRPLIQGDLDRVTSAGVQSTPTFFVGDSVIAGAYPLAEFVRVIDAQLARAAATPKKR